jgi:hypothetical protein
MPEIEFKKDDIVKIKHGELYSEAKFVESITGTENVKCSFYDIKNSKWEETAVSKNDISPYVEKDKYPRWARLLLWFFVNCILGLAPLWFFYLINIFVTKEDAKAKAISLVNDTIKGGAIIFVCSAIMCSVVIDIYLEKVKLGKFLANAFLQFAPFLILVVLLFAYFFKVYDFISYEPFDIGSTLFWIIIPLTSAYSCVAKYSLLKD